MLRLPLDHRLSAMHLSTTSPILVFFALAQCCEVLLAAVVSSSMMVLTTDASPEAGHIRLSVIHPCSFSALTTLHTGAPEEGLWFNSFSVRLHASASLTANCCCRKSEATGASVSPDSLMSATRGVVYSVTRMDLVCRFRRSWRSSPLPASLESQQSSLPYSATAWTYATWMAPTL